MKLAIRLDVIVAVLLYTMSAIIPQLGISLIASIIVVAFSIRWDRYAQSMGHPRGMFLRPFMIVVVILWAAGEVISRFLSYSHDYTKTGELGLALVFAILALTSVVLFSGYLSGYVNRKWSTPKSAA